MNQNTTYIETTMGNDPIGTNAVTTRDHFWDVGSDEDGRHRFIQSPAFTVGGVATNPVLGTGMDGVCYLKETNGRVEGFYRNASGVYQYIPSLLTGSVALSSTSTYATVVAVPASVYGEIFMYTTAIGKYSTVTGFFRSNGTTVEAWSILNKTSGASTSYALEFANGSDASGLNIRARRGDGANATYNYIITYRAI